LFPLIAVSFFLVLFILLAGRLRPRAVQGMKNENFQFRVPEQVNKKGKKMGREEEKGRKN